MHRRSYKIGRDVSRWLGATEQLGFLPAVRLMYKAYLGGGKRESYDISIPGLEFPIKIRKNSTDVNVFMQIFAMREYDLGLFKQSDAIMARYEKMLSKGIKPLIIDCGANCGMATLWWKKLFPKAKIVAIEADSQNFIALEENAGKYRDVDCIHAAVWSRKTKLKPENPTDEAWSRRFSETERPNPAEDDVTDTVTIPEIVAENGGPDSVLVVKIDIEGGEKQLFSENTSWVQDVPLLIIETHDSLQPFQKTSLNFIKEIAKHDAEICFNGENAFAYITS